MYVFILLCDACESTRSHSKLCLFILERYLSTHLIRAPGSSSSVVISEAVCSSRRFLDSVASSYCLIRLLMALIGNKINSYDRSGLGRADACLFLDGCQGGSAEFHVVCVWLLVSGFLFQELCFLPCCGALPWRAVTVGRVAEEEKLEVQFLCGCFRFHGNLSWR